MAELKLLCVKFVAPWRWFVLMDLNTVPSRDCKILSCEEASRIFQFHSLCTLRMIKYEGHPRSVDISLETGTYKLLRSLKKNYKPDKSQFKI